MLKLTKNLFSVVLLAGVFSFGGIAAHDFSSAFAAEKIPVAKAAVIDVNQVLNTSQIWKDAEVKMKGRVADVQKLINVKRDALKAQADELKRQKTILAPDVFQQKAKAIGAGQRALQREAQVSNAKVRELLNQVRGRLKGVIVKISAKVASEKGMNIGFDRNNVIFFDDAMDITNEVLKRFNASKTKVEITVDKKK
ncbi:MAG: OmpH family outer membrane protein [Sneathiella sp.]|nr:OmpH family outer membrane protein [Sneathiella sp.]